MPNTEVKLTNAESTWPEAAWEDRKLLIQRQKRRACAEMHRPFSFLPILSFFMGREYSQKMTLYKIIHYYKKANTNIFKFYIHIF